MRSVRQVTGEPIESSCVHLGPPLELRSLKNTVERLPAGTESASPLTGRGGAEGGTGAGGAAKTRLISVRPFPLTFRPDFGIFSGYQIAGFRGSMGRFWVPIP